jgi:aryl-alcohol dehydrogenase-like predicted oxidoreductase
MRYQLLGKSGLRVSELCLGTMTFGETWGWGASKEESLKQFEMFDEAGGNFLDTSVNYTDGTSEEFLGDFLQKRRDQFVVATKYTLTRPDSTDPNSGGNSIKNMRQSVERSLRRLQTDYLDILYLHMWDYLTPVEEVMRGLDMLVQSGKVNYVAISDSPAYIVAEANTLAALRGYPQFLGLQVPYHLGRRDIERELVPMAQHWNMSILPWGIVGQGILLGKYSANSTEVTRHDKTRVNISDKMQNIVDMVAAIADETGRSRAQVCVNWVRQRPYSRFIPILGARSTSQLADNLAALEWKLDDDQLKRLDDVSAFEMGFPHDFLPKNPYVFGATHDLIDR